MNTTTAQAAYVITRVHSIITTTSRTTREVAVDNPSPNMTLPDPEGIGTRKGFTWEGHLEPGDAWKRLQVLSVTCFYRRTESGCCWLPLPGSAPKLIVFHRCVAHPTPHSSIITRIKWNRVKTSSIRLRRNKGTIKLGVIHEAGK